MAKENELLAAISATELIEELKSLRDSILDEEKKAKEEAKKIQAGPHAIEDVIRATISVAELRGGASVVNHIIRDLEGLVSREKEAMRAKAKEQRPDSGEATAEGE